MNEEKFQWLKCQNNDYDTTVEKEGWNYYVNPLGYRQDPNTSWPDNWENSIVLLGCSQTFGWGVNYENTYARLLEKSLNRQVINLGIPATSIDYMFKLSIDICKRSTPWAIVVNWPDISRYYEWHTGRKGMLTHEFGNRDPELYDYFLKNYDYKIKQTEYLMDAIRLMWRGKTNLIEITWSSSIKNVTRIDNVDTALDDSHWGPKTHSVVNDHLSFRLSDSL